MQLKIFSFLAMTIYFSIVFSSERDNDSTMRFEKIAPKLSGIEFNNRITEDQVHNFFNFSYIYNGGGVAVGDINNDGLADIYFTGNQVSNNLYLNQGNFKFKNITDQAFSSVKAGWSNGVSMVDINNDQLIDIYVSRSGLYQNPTDRENLLFINNGDLTFTERASQYGLNDSGFSTQAYFFDYDRDNDLDLFLVNHRYDFENNNTVVPRDSIGYDQFSSDQLYRNNGNGTFSNVTKDAGIINYTWGLSATISDFNNDGWDDIYVANDYVEPDNLYINNQDGSFTESISRFVKHTSYYSMGSDLADINNDGFQDLIVLDMVPEDHVRAKRLMTSMSTENFWRLIDSGLHYQYMSNTLQLNQGNGMHSEIAQLSRISKTDWSWAPLFADFDKDGYQDLFVTNGIKRDITDNDFYSQLNALTKTNQQLNFADVISTMPATKLQNYLYRNQGDLTFKQVNIASQLTDLTNSNGAAYADFDNDGDVDLVVNNLDEPASLYRNTTPQKTGHYLQVKLQGPKQNSLGIGALVSLEYGQHKQIKKQMLSRGYLSSIDPILHFGLGKHSKINKLAVQWSDTKTTVVNAINANQQITIHYSDATLPEQKQVATKQLFSNITETLGLHYRHHENTYNDFKREILLPHKQSEHGPYLTVGDVNGDRLDDFFVGGSAGSPGKLLIQTIDNTFISAISQPWVKDAKSEDLGALLFDADNDKDLDLYIVSGGNEFEVNSPEYSDRLYLNDGVGVFSKATALPELTSSGMRVIAGDYDNDGDLDLFVGGRVVPGLYPKAPVSYLLQNQNGQFTDVTKQIAPGLSSIGMVTDADFIDYDNDGDLDLVLVGEWMPISVFENKNKHFVDVTTKLGFANTRGWWQSLAHGDFDNDGDLDFIAGNIGKNNKYQPTQAKPLTVYANDFDSNGSLDIVLASNKNNRDLPIRGRQCSAQQVPELNSKFPTFKAFADADLPSIYSTDKLATALKLNAEVFSSSIVINKGGQGFEIRPLPNTAQFSPITGLVIDDFNHDKHLDVLYTGNLYGAEVETVRYDAGIGGLLLGNGQAEFQSVSPSESGFITPKNARDLKQIQLGKKGQKSVIVSNNNDELQIFKLD